VIPKAPQVALASSPHRFHTTQNRAGQISSGAIRLLQSGPEDGPLNSAGHSLPPVFRRKIRPARDLRTRAPLSSLVSPCRAQRSSSAIAFRKFTAYSDAPEALAFESTAFQTCHKKDRRNADPRPSDLHVPWRSNTAFVSWGDRELPSASSASPKFAPRNRLGEVCSLQIRAPVLRWQKSRTLGKQQFI